jgi:hypothetical protein
MTKASPITPQVEDCDGPFLWPSRIRMVWYKVSIASFMGVDGRESKCVISAAVLLETMAAARAGARGGIEVPVLKLNDYGTGVVKHV